jgi:chloride channel protein, CIC family
MKTKRQKFCLPNLGFIIFLGFIIGCLSGLAGILFHDLIALFHNLFFAAKASIHYDVDHHTPESVWGIGIILVPVIVSIPVVWMVKNFAPEAKGHGVPEVMDAVYFKDGKLRPVSIFVKAVTAALSIGSGGSVGREGPIVQICAALGSSISQWLGLSSEQRSVLLCCGASSGIAATFNAPIAGMLFVVELLMPRVVLSTLVPVIVSTVASTYVGAFWFGIQPAFNIPELRIPALHLQDYWALLAFIPLGIIIGLGGLFFIRCLYLTEKFFNRLPINDYFRHMLGMLLIGCNLYVWFLLTGHYYLDGIGYSVIMEVLRGLQDHFGLLMMLYFFKVFATSVTIGSGGSGGIFSPSLFFGAMLGAACGVFCDYYFPFLGLNPVVCAIAGMAGMVSAVTGALMVGLVIVVEMTGDYNAIMPIMLTTAFAALTRYYFAYDSVYTEKLLRRGVTIDQGLISINHYMK